MPRPGLRRALPCRCEAACPAALRQSLLCSYPGRVLRTRTWKSSSLRLLNDSDRDEALGICDSDAVANVFVGARLLRPGPSFARIEGGRVVFKAEIGSVPPQVCQVQGVWVPPDLRGRGIASHGM